MVSQLVLSVPAREGKVENFQSIQGDVFYDPRVYPHDSMNPIGAFSPEISLDSSEEANSYYSIISATIELFSSD